MTIIDRRTLRAVGSVVLDVIYRGLVLDKFLKINAIAAFSVAWPKQNNCWSLINFIR